MDDARATYLAGREARARDLQKAEARSHAVGTARLIVAVVAVALVVARVWGPLGGSAWWGVGACVAAFVAFVLWHASLDDVAARARAALRFHERGIARIDDAWRTLASDGARFASVEHPYTDDLDVFGHASLFQRIDATQTSYGEGRLAGWLRAACDVVDLSVVESRQRAVKDLASRAAFREALFAAGAVEAKPDPEPFVAWAEGALPLRGADAWKPVAWALPILLACGVAATSFFGVTGLAWLIPGVLELGVTLYVARRLERIAGAVSAREGAFARFGAMLALLEAERFEAPLLTSLQSRLRASGAVATREMARLERLRGLLDARNNEVWRFVVGPMLLWDLHCVLALEAWRGRAGAHVRGWLEALGEIEALASLAGYAFENPAHTFPEIVAEPRFDGTAIGHPLLDPRKRRDNDVALPHGGSVLVVTGSNMSGKSTLLRAIGLNAILALAGGPVCAKKLVIGPLRVAASMCIRDSLSEGVSRFYAEVRKLRGVLERARLSRVPATLFLLDEVLSGTNARERIIGARAIVRELARCGAIGAVSTHDLALGEIDPDLAQSIFNVHFEEQIEGDVMTFDYVLRPGVVKSSNALRIMKMVGIDVVPVG